MWFPKPHQIRGAKEIAAGMLLYNWFYLAWEERVGKSLAALHGMNQAGFKNVLILTKKGTDSAVIKGWLETIQESGIEDCKFKVINYHQLGSLKPQPGKRKKLVTLKEDMDEFDAVILDESHNYISGFPKPSSMHIIVRSFVSSKPCLFLSATPHAQGYHLLFHQLKVMRYSPWAKYINFYDWWKDYGIPNEQYIGAGTKRETYTKIKEAMVLEDISINFSTLTRAEVGMKYEPEDVIHKIVPSAYTKKIYNTLIKDKVLTIQGSEIVLDSVMKERVVLHQLEGGTIKHENGVIYLDNREKIDYILEEWGDTTDVVIMYHYKGEGILLESIFKNAKVVQATSNAEGVDYSMHEHLIIYSQDFSTARHSQRRARQANFKRDTAIKVNYLIVEGSISEQVYETVSVNKVNFIDKLYERKAI